MKMIIENLKNIMKRLGKEEKGMGVIEIVLIILVLVGLALVFKNQISGVANGGYDSIKSQVNSF